MVAGVELETNAAGHEISNPQSEKQSFSHKTQSWIALAELAPTYNCPASLFSTAPSLFGTNSDHGPMVAGCRDISANLPNTEHSLGELFLKPCHYNFKRGTRVIMKTTVASKTRKTISAWWLASNLKQMPLAMKCQNKQSEKQGFSNIIPSWIALAKLVTTCNCRFLAPHSLYLGPIQTMVAGCRDISANLPNTEHSLGELFLNFATTAVIAAPVRLTRLGWFPRQARPSVHGGWRLA